MEKTNIRLCMGSSCFTRGNDEILKKIQDYIKVNSLTDRVDFRGHLCEGNCNHGPNLMINGKAYHEVSESTIEIILNKSFGLETLK